MAVACSFVQVFVAAALMEYYISKVSIAVTHLCLVLELTTTLNRISLIPGEDSGLQDL